MTELKPNTINLSQKEYNDLVKPIRTFVIVHPDGTESGSYRGRSPRQAALKAIKTFSTNMGHPVTFKLRERGTKKLHVFKGYTYMQMARLPWMKVDSYIKVAEVQKIGIEKINQIGPALVAEDNIGYNSDPNQVGGP